MGLNSRRAPQVLILGHERRYRAPTAHSKLRHLDLIKQFRVAIKDFEQFHKGQWRFGLAILAAGEVMAAAIAEKEQRPAFRCPKPGRKAKTRG